jgi:hypothetical protein
VNDTPISAGEKPPFIPGRMLIRNVHQHQEWFFRCDDRGGYLLSILWASDGDLHLSIVADPDHEDFAANRRRVSGSVRLRLPMIGGGMYEYLQPAIMEAMRAERDVEEGRTVRAERPGVPTLQQRLEDSVRAAQAARDALAQAKEEIAQLKRDVTGCIETVAAANARADQTGNYLHDVCWEIDRGMFDEPHASDDLVAWAKRSLAEQRAQLAQEKANYTAAVQMAGALMQSHEGTLKGFLESAGRVVPAGKNCDELAELVRGLIWDLRRHGRPL